MALYYPTCDITITPPNNTDCPVKELGDIRGFAFVKDTFSFTNISDTSEWTTGINAEDIYVFNLGRGSLDITENEVAGFGDNDTTIDGYQFVANIMEPNYKANWAFWNSIKESRNFKFVYRTETLVHLTDATVSIAPKAPITEGDKKAAIIWQVVIKWAQEDLPEPQDMPSGVFDRAIDI